MIAMIHSIEQLLILGLNHPNLEKISAYMEGNEKFIGHGFSPFNHENALRFGRSFNKLINMTYFSLKREKTTRKKILGFHGT